MEVWKNEMKQYLICQLHEKMVLSRQQNKGQQIKFLLLQPKILLQQPNVLLTELNILL